MNKNLRQVGWIGLLVVTILLVLVVRTPAASATAKHYTELEFAPLKEVKIPDYERYQLKNGMVVYLMEDRELPLVSGSAIVKTGQRLEPSEKVGLADLVGTVMRSGGSELHPADELNQILEAKAAIVETSIDTSSGVASFDALSEDLDRVFNLFAEVIRSPAFPQDKLELAKNQQKGSISRRNDDPSDIASREFQKLLYGKDSPYGRTIEYATLDNISREDIINFYANSFYPDRTILGIVGDFDSTEMKVLIEKAFGDWQPAPKSESAITIPSASQKQKTGVFLVDRPDLTQSNILLGHIGGQLDSPDYPALTVVNGVLNGYGGRLFNDIRARQGLAYSVYGLWSARYDYPGMFIAGGQTRSETTTPFIKSVFSEIEKMQTTPITEAELAYAKESILNSFVFNFQKPKQTLSRSIRYEYFGYPKDFIFQYQNGVKETEIADVQRVAQQYLKPEQIITLVVGNGNEIQPPLSSLGQKVKAVDITIPRPQKS
jgi:zinc protease